MRKLSGKFHLVLRFCTRKRSETYAKGSCDRERAVSPCLCASWFPAAGPLFRWPRRHDVPLLYRLDQYPISFLQSLLYLQSDLSVWPIVIFSPVQAVLLLNLPSPDISCGPNVRSVFGMYILTQAFGLPKPSLFCIVQRDVASLSSYSKLNSNSSHVILI